MKIENIYDTIQEIVSKASNKLTQKQFGFILAVIGIVSVALYAVSDFFSENNQLKPDVASPNQ